MYDILVYLFENCQQREVAYERERIAKKLSAAGFERFRHQRSAALARRHGPRAADRRRCSCPIRAQLPRLAPRELAKLDAQCRGFLITLEQSGILDAAERASS